MDSKLVCFCFKGNISQKVLENLDFKNCYILESNEDSIKKFVDQLKPIQPEFILGLGQYTGRDQDKIRIETVCTNKFKNQIIENKLEILSINPFLTPNSLAKFSRGMGNSYCNLVSFLIKKNIDCQYTFLHLPKSFEASKATTVILNLLQDLYNTKRR
jgi:pyrrolidone-carboxylate peptidase